MRQNEVFKRDYDRLSQELNLTYKEIEEFGYVKVSWTNGEASDATDFETLEIKDIVEKILSFKAKGGWDDPDEKSLGMMLQKDCSKDPQKYSRSLQNFINVPHIYAYYLINSFENTWNNDKEIDWTNVLRYILDYLNNPLFGSSELEGVESDTSHDYQLILRSIGQLISSGLKADSHAFDSSLNNITQEIVFRCIKWAEPTEDFEATNMDYPTYFINSTNGKIIDSIILLSLRKARIKGYKIDSKEIKWNDETRDVFEKLLVSKFLEAYITLGFYFRNIMYLDSTWIQGKIEENQDQESTLLWRAIIESYVFNSDIIEDVQIFELFKPYYKRYILSANDKFRYSGITDHCTSYFLLGYDNKSEESLITEIICSKKTYLVNSMINNIWWKWKNDLFSAHSRKEILEESIIVLWKDIIKVFSEDEYSESKKCISYSTRLLSLFNQIDDRILPLIMKSCEYLQYGYDASNLIEELHRLKDHGEIIIIADHVLEIYKKMLQVVSPDYNPRHIQDTIEFIYKIEYDPLKEKCNEVCNIYATRGYFLLRGIYSKYNSL